jgi:tryptophan synthase alpha chain
LAPEDPARGLSRGFAHGRPALVAYVMGGYPDRAGSLAALRALARAGADVIELGVPYGDPIADGPVIVEAAKTAMAAAGGFGLAETLELAAAFVSDPGVETAPPIALMTYLNPMLRYGLPRLAQAARDAGVSGFIVPDLPPDGPMTASWLAASRPAGLDTVFLAAPTSTPDRLAKVGAASRGFVYCVSTMGVTGERGELPPELGSLVARVKASTGLPVAVGFGISTPEQAASVSRLADGVVVGSAIVRRQTDVACLERYVHEIGKAVHGV